MMHLIFLLLSLVTFTSASSQSRHTLHFHNEIIDTRYTPSTWIHPSAQHKYQYMDTHHHMHIMQNGQPTPTILENDNGEKHTYLVKFRSPYTITAKTRVESFLNITFSSYIPHDSFLSYMYAIQAKTLIQSEEMKSIVYGVYPYNATLKLHSCVTKPSIDQGVELDLLLVSDYDQSQQLAMGGIWTRGLSTEIPQNINGSNFDWSLGARNIMGINLKNEAQVQAFAEWIAHMDEVVMVQRRVKFRTSNMWARGEAEKAIPVPNYQTKQGLITFDHPELRGQGEVIGVSDTGLDYNSCYFFDPKFPDGPPGVKTYVSQLTTPNILRAKPLDQQHRKIVQYINFVDGDDADGHGTHVAGTIAGNGWNFPTGSILKNFDGLASEAKLAFFDIGSSITGGLDVPKNMDQDLFTWAYAAGARIHSDSWGGVAGGYDINAQMVDTFIYNNPDMLVLFAAGNDGIKGAGSISSPSTAKNAMAIGSSMNSNEAWIASFCEGGVLPQTKLCSVARTYPVLFGSTSMSAFSSQGPTPDSADVGRLKPEIVLPGQWVLSASNGQNKDESCSSPAADVLKRDAGTSMSTPAAAAMAAIIRQWLRSGYYPSGEARIEDQFIPSAALMKAIMIASVKPLTGYYDGNDILFPGGRPPPLPKEAALVPLEPTPNYRQGYGRFELQNGIYFPTDQHRLLIFQDKTQKFYDPRVVASGDTRSMTFCVTGTLSSQLPPRVTLTWTDPPVIATVTSVVVNNLDLTVTPLGGTRIFQGNEGLAGVTPGNPDKINNVESVTLPNTNTPTTYVATVRATSLVQGPQPFALVVSGRVKMGACDSAPVETFQWVSTPWGSCTQPCYSTTVGIQKRNVFCVSSLTGGVADTKCTNLGAKPQETQACNTNPCYLIKYYWQPGSYGRCTQTCGGTKTRQVVCMGTTGFAGTPEQCSGTKPAITTTCAQDTCINALSNLNSQWSVSTCQCSATCGGGTCTRTVDCLQNGVKVPDDVCINAGNGAKPIPLQQCNTHACGVAPSAAGAGSGETFSWLVSDWSSCSVVCGGGLQTRSVRCRSSAGYLDEDRLCTTPKPATSATCARDACPASVEPPTYNWIIGIWGACNVQTLQQTRWVICSTTSGQIVDPATCESAVGTMPMTSQTCTPTSTSQSENLVAPTYQWFTGTWSDPTIWCGPGSGTQTRLPLCLGSAGRVAPTQASCPTPIPATTQSVARNATCTTRPVWYTGAWLSECTNTNNPCNGVQQRHVVCVGTDGRVLGDTSLCTDTPPASTRGCSTCVRTTTASDATQHMISTWLIFLSILITCWITRQ